MKQQAAFPADSKSLVPRSRLNELKSLGHDFIEAGGEGSLVYDAAGRKYLDCCSGAGTFNLGRRRPELRDELRRTMRLTDQGNFPMISQEKAGLAEALARFVPGALECSMFSVMRGEAFDFACKLARGVTNRPELLAPAGSWFGQTGFALALSQRTDDQDFAPSMPGCRTLPFNDLEAARAAIGPRTAAVLLEPIQAENGCREHDAAFLREVQRLCREAGALLVLDETQTGFGRVGARFAFEQYGLEPDVLILGEALGGGMFPIAATLFTSQIGRFMSDHPLIHLSTFGGSDLGCTVAQRALALYEQLKPWNNAAAAGLRLKPALDKLALKHPKKLRAVAGRGLLLSLELSSPARAARLCKLLAGQGVLALPGEVNQSCVLLRPSLLIEDAEIARLERAVSKALIELR